MRSRTCRGAASLEARKLVAERARSLVGIAYRPKGRGPEGLDCVGVAALALALPAAAVPQAYDRRRTAAGVETAFLRASGLEIDETDRIEPGDLLVFAPGLGQLHLGIATAGAFVHADLGLRRVVERPFPPPWPIAGVWRLVDPVRKER
jgi:cell wall-associated NlpC family hydrolase